MFAKEFSFCGGCLRPICIRNAQGLRDGVFKLVCWYDPETWQKGVTEDQSIRRVHSPRLPVAPHIERAESFGRTFVKFQSDIDGTFRSRRVKKDSPFWIFWVQARDFAKDCGNVPRKKV